MYLRLSLLLLLPMFVTAQDRNLDMERRHPHSDYKDGFDRRMMVYHKARGYIVYKGDTLKGAVLLSRTVLYFEKYEFGGSSKYYEIKLRNSDLSTIVMYNYDNKPLCMTRIKPSDRKMRRLIHEGKLNIYDDWMQYIYHPSDIDPYLLIVSYNGEVDELGSFSRSGTRHDLIGYINDIYGLTLPYSMPWPKLLHTIDELD